MMFRVYLFLIIGAVLSVIGVGAYSLTQNVTWSVVSAGPSGPPPAVVASAPYVSCGGASANTCGFSITLVSGTILIFSVEYPVGSGFVSVTSSPSNLANCAPALGTTAPSFGWPTSGAIISCQVTGGGTTSVTTNWSHGSNYLFGISDWSNLATAPDEGIGAYSPTTASVNLNGPTRGGNDLIYSWAFTYNSTGPGQLCNGSTSVCSNQVLLEVVGQYFNDFAQYALASSPGPQTVSAATGASAILAASFANVSTPVTAPQAGSSPATVSMPDTTKSGTTVSTINVATNGGTFTGTIAMSDPKSLVSLQNVGLNWRLVAARDWTTADIGTDTITLTPTMNSISSPFTVTLTVGPTTITAINPPTINIYDYQASTTPVAEYTCATNDGTTCKATWTATGLPSFLTLSSGGELTLNRALTSADDCSPLGTANCYSWTVTPTLVSTSASPRCPDVTTATGIPAPARMAGFLTQHTCADFETAIPNTVGTPGLGVNSSGNFRGGQGSWLGCPDPSGGGPGDSFAHIFYSPQPTAFYSPPCTLVGPDGNHTFEQVTDGTNGLALQIEYTPYIQQTVGDKLISVATSSDSYVGSGFPQALLRNYPVLNYTEYTFRTNSEGTYPYGKNNEGANIDLFEWSAQSESRADTVGIANLLEKDIVELWSNNFTNANPPGDGLHNWHVPNSSLPWQVGLLWSDYPSLGLPKLGGLGQQPGGFSAYHTIGVLTTSDGLQNIVSCLYFDGVFTPTAGGPVSNPFYPCGFYPTPVDSVPGPVRYGMGAGSAAEMQSMIWWIGNHALAGGNLCPNSSSVYDASCLVMPDGALYFWLKDVKIFTCGGGIGENPVNDFNSSGTGANPHCLGETSRSIGPNGEKYFRVVTQ